MSGPAGVSVIVDKGQTGVRGNNILLSKGNPNIPGNLSIQPIDMDLAIDIDRSSPTYLFLYRLENLLWKPLFRLVPNSVSLNEEAFFINGQANLSLQIPIPPGIDIGPNILEKIDIQYSLASYTEDIAYNPQEEDLSEQLSYEDSSFYDNLEGEFAASAGRQVQTTAIQSDHKILVGGSFNEFNGNIRRSLIRINTDGTEDIDFYNNLGVAFTGGSGGVKSIVIQSDGKILVGGGFTYFNGNPRPSLIRLNDNGTEDIAFSSNLGNILNDAVESIAVQSDNKILIGGRFTSFNGNTRRGIVRLNTDGTEDTDFYNDLGDNFIGARIYSLAVQSDGKILVGGSWDESDGNTTNSIIRLNQDGTGDTAFNNNLGSGFLNNNVVYAIAIQSDGKILLGGTFNLFNGNIRRSLIRLNADGTEDAAFYANFEDFFAQFSAFNHLVLSVAVQSDKKILLGMYLSASSAPKIIRLNEDGTGDIDFNNNLGSGFNGSVYSLVLQPAIPALFQDEGILVGGRFTEFNGNVRDSLLRLRSNRIYESLINRPMPSFFSIEDISVVGGIAIIDVTFNAVIEFDNNWVPFNGKKTIHLVVTVV